MEPSLQALAAQVGILVQRRGVYCSSHSCLSCGRSPRVSCSLMIAKGRSLACAICRRENVRGVAVVGFIVLINWNRYLTIARLYRPRRGVDRSELKFTQDDRRRNSKRVHLHPRRAVGDHGEAIMQPWDCIFSAIGTCKRQIWLTVIQILLQPSPLFTTMKDRDRFQTCVFHALVIFIRYIRHALDLIWSPFSTTVRARYLVE